MKTLATFLEMDNDMMLKTSIFTICGDSEYIGICGNRYDAAMTWFDHNVSYFDEVSNAKYTGWVLTLENRELKFYVPNWVLNVKPTDWRHANNLFRKYIKQKC